MRRWQRLVLTLLSLTAIVLAAATVITVLYPERPKDHDSPLANLTREDLDRLSVQLQEAPPILVLDDTGRQHLTVAAAEQLYNADGTPKERPLLVSQRGRDKDTILSQDEAYLILAALLGAIGAFGLYHMLRGSHSPR